MNIISRTLNQWKGGVRLYIAIATLATTLEVWWWANASYSGTALYASRMAEIFAWLGLALIATAVSIGPFYKVFSRVPGRRQWFEARRLLGVSGAWFATLHSLIAYGSEFNFANPTSLPSVYQRAFIAGGIALIILLAMVATSFDKAFTAMGIWWFRLHRFVYVALVAILGHAFAIGVHATQHAVLLVLSLAAVWIVGLHIFRQKTRPTIWQLAGLTAMAIALFTVFNYGYSKSQQNQSSGGSYAYAK
ncbi:MAG: ferric reductase-like transmembrane domain-containing protein [Patescibacteria group bacterium]|nr:ferric reductase-like transmembrane domain-containing protein [Patescibacteria group bacterium]